jgi:protein SCO1/2
MAELAEVKRLLGADAGKLQGLFVTLDPERDTPEVLKAYMGNFDPAFLALRPETQELPDLAKHFKIFYKKNEGKTAGSYTLDHTAASYVFDPQGRVRLYTRHGMGPAALSEDLKILLKGA